MQKPPPTTTDAASLFNPARLPSHRRSEYLPLRASATERKVKTSPDWEQWTPHDDRGMRFTLELAPILPADALACLTARGSRPGLTVLLGFTRLPGGAAAELARVGETSRNLLEFLGTAGSSAAASGPDSLVLDDVALMRALRNGLAGFTDAIRLESGDSDRIEPVDLESVIAAAVPRRSPLEADLRTIAWLRFGEGGTLSVASRRRAVVHELAAEGVALYLAAQLGVSPREVARPDAWRLGQLLGVSGHLELHPKETLLATSFADVGCCCSAPSERHPAAVSLIYDLPSRTWHGEEG